MSCGNTANLCGFLSTLKREKCWTISEYSITGNPWKSHHNSKSNWQQVCCNCCCYFNTYCILKQGLTKCSLWGKQNSLVVQMWLSQHPCFSSNSTFLFKKRNTFLLSKFPSAFWSLEVAHPCFQSSLTWRVHSREYVLQEHFSMRAPKACKSIQMCMARISVCLKTKFLLSSIAISALFLRLIRQSMNKTEWFWSACKNNNRQHMKSMQQLLGMNEKKIVLYSLYLEVQPSYS